MPHIIGLKIQTASDDQRDDLLERLIVLFNNMMQPGDELVMTLKNERPTARGKRQTIETVEWQAGEPAPNLVDFGIISTQHDLWQLASKLRAAGVELHPVPTPLTPSAPSAPSDESDAVASAPAADELTPLERMINDALRDSQLDKLPPSDETADDADADAE